MDWRDCIYYLQEILYFQKDILQVKEQIQKQKGIGGLSDLSRRPHNIKYKKVTSKAEETILDLRLIKRFGCNRKV